MSVGEEVGVDKQKKSRRKSRASSESPRDFVAVSLPSARFFFSDASREIFRLYSGGYEKERAKNNSSGNSLSGEKKEKGILARAANRKSTSIALAIDFHCGNIARNVEECQRCGEVWLCEKIRKERYRVHFLCRKRERTREREVIKEGAQ